MFPISTLVFPNPNNNNNSLAFLIEHDDDHLGCTLNAAVSRSHNNITTKKKKKKRSLPGHPDPDAEVIALSPETLLASNRFICEICKRSFQREQNLQLHRRGHNLPWKLKRRRENSKKQVYVCPEPSCVHHHPSRALGDLTGIKKHFSRKHGEKKWKCHKCSKLYAVHSDWKAHSKTCGTRHYTCDCGAVFSRKDSFVTHRAFCDALAQETARLSAAAAAAGRSSEDGALMMKKIISSTNYYYHNNNSAQNPNPSYNNNNNYSTTTAADPPPFGYSSVAAALIDGPALGTYHAHDHHQRLDDVDSLMISGRPTNDQHHHVMDIMRDDQFMVAGFPPGTDHNHVMMSRQDNQECLTRNFWV